MERYFCDKCGKEKEQHSDLNSFTLSSENRAFSVPTRVNVCLVCAIDLKEHLNLYLETFKFTPKKLL